MSRASIPILSVLHPWSGARFRKHYVVGAVDECWEWQGTLLKSGYGAIQVSRDYKRQRIALLAHRVAWVLEHGCEIPAGKLICHRCDNRRCVNPAHLYVGTSQTNMDDQVARGRRAPMVAPWLRVKGAEHPAARYSTEQRSRAIELRSLGSSFAQIAKDIGIPRDAASRWWGEHVRAMSEKQRHGVPRRLMKVVRKR